MDWVMRVSVGVVAVLAMAAEAAGYGIGQVGATAQALDNAAASTHASVTAMQRTPLVTPIAAAPAPAPAPMARAANDTTGSGTPPGGGGNGPGGNVPGAGGPGGQGNGGPGNGGPGNGGPGGPGGPFNHPVPPGAAKKMSEVLGEIVWLMSQSPLHKQFFISDLEWFVMTPVLLQQFRLFYAQDRPLGVVLWGQVSEDVEKRLIGGQPKLQPTDWKSGEKIWAVEVIAPFGGAEEMVKDLKTKVFPDRPVHYVTVTKDGKKEVRVV